MAVHTVGAPMRSAAAIVIVLSVTASSSSDDGDPDVLVPPPSAEFTYHAFSSALNVGNGIATSSRRNTFIAIHSALEHSTAPYVRRC